MPACAVLIVAVAAQWEETQPQRGLASVTESLRADQALLVQLARHVAEGVTESSPGGSSLDHSPPEHSASSPASLDYFGESGRNSNVFTADVHNLQTPDHFADAGNMVAALAALDARDHPGVTGTIESIVVAAAVGRVQALGGSLSETEMRAVLTVAGWPVELLGEALTVAYCESKWSNAKGDHNGHPTDGGYMSQGLFQMGVAGWRWVNGEWLWWNGWFLYFGYEDWQALDPVVNATVAYLAYQRSGWGPWTCARLNGVY